MLTEYLTSFDLENIEKVYTDVLVIGSGIAGSYTAINIDDEVKVTLIAKDKLKENNTYKAQGGIAAAMDDGDKVEYHYEDTLKSGAGICSKEAVKVLTEEGPENIFRLIDKANVKFDKVEGNKFSFTREGAHSKNRIVHFKDYTGKYVEDRLIDAVMAKSNIEVCEHTIVIDLIRCNGKIYGAIVSKCKESSSNNYSSDEIYAIIAKKTVLASGGIGMMYKVSTNSTIATGDGIAAAFRAGAVLKDMEFVQFHPTGFIKKDGSVFLISESLRGEGAILKNSNNEAFMEKYHPLKDLATRDIVSRSILSEMKKFNQQNMFLDITFENREYLKDRFESIFSTLLEDGIDMSKDMIPVKPVHHYFMGGIKTDVNGRTSLENLYAVGECACSGIHGANRLASNSLLEALVFGYRIANEINKVHLENKECFIPKIKYHNSIKDDKTSDINFDSLKQELKELMELKVGALREKEGLLETITFIENGLKKLETCKLSKHEEYEVVNMYQVAYLIAKASFMREESRGGHYRKDFSYADDENWMSNIIHFQEKGEISNVKLDIDR